MGNNEHIVSFKIPTRSTMQIMCFLEHLKMTICTKIVLAVPLLASSSQKIYCSKKTLRPTRLKCNVAIKQAL